MSRTNWRLQLLLCCTLVINGAACLAAEPEPMPLWPQGAPSAVGEGPADRPTLTVYLPAADKANGAAMVVCPGGGYGGLAMDHEGRQVAEWLNANGLAALVLRYRHAPHYRHPTPLGDAQRAIRTARHGAQDWRFDPGRVGIIGFSAGGHLASSTGTHFDTGQTDAADPIDRQSCRPDWMVLVYPVISMSEPFTHAGSRRNLLGDSPDSALLDLMSSEKQVTPQTPPTFLIHSTEDAAVKSENSVAMYAALRRAGVAAEMHIYQQGPHGFGLGGKDEALATWPGLCMEWLRRNKFF